jgi:hypothetical protein
MLSLYIGSHDCSNGETPNMKFQYTIVERREPGLLEKAVNDLAERGYRPCGGLVVYTDLRHDTAYGTKYGIIVFSQAMSKEQTIE